MGRVPAAMSAVLAAAALLGGVMVGGVTARAVSPAYQVANVGAYGGKPSIASDGRISGGWAFGDSGS